MNLTARSEKITRDAWGYGVRVAQSVKTRKLTRLEKVGEDSLKGSGIAWVDKSIRNFNSRLEFGPQYPDYWARS